MEVLFEVVGAVEIDIMIAQYEETGVGFGLRYGVVTQSGSRHPEAGLAALVHHIAGMNGENGFRVVALGSDILVKAVVFALWHNAISLRIMRVGAGIDMILVGCILNDGHPMLIVVVNPICDPGLSIAAVDEHTGNIQTVAACGHDCGCGNYNKVLSFHCFQF